MQVRWVWHSPPPPSCHEWTERDKFLCTEGKKKQFSNLIVHATLIIDEIFYSFSKVNNMVFAKQKTLNSLLMENSTSTPKFSILMHLAFKWMWVALTFSSNEWLFMVMFCISKERINWLLLIVSTIGQLHSILILFHKFVVSAACDWKLTWRRKLRLWCEGVLRKKDLSG